MKLNSTAVMQRRLEAADSLDDFPTPPWATRALCEYLSERDFISRTDSCREPAANRGYMARTLEEYFDTVEASDVFDYGVGYPVKDFLNDSFEDVDWTITNPPFVLAKDFIQKSFGTTTKGIAVILRTAFLEGKRRYEELFSEYPPAYVLQFVERVPMVKGRYDPTASSATAYAWFVWLAADNGVTTLDWLPSCKDELTDKEKDYPSEE